MPKRRKRRSNAGNPASAVAGTSLALERCRSILLQSCFPRTTFFFFPFLSSTRPQAPLRLLLHPVENLWGISSSSIVAPLHHSAHRVIVGGDILRPGGLRHGHDLSLLRSGGLPRSHANCTESCSKTSSPSCSQKKHSSSPHPQWFSPQGQRLSFVIDIRILQSCWKTALFRRADCE